MCFFLGIKEKSSHANVSFSQTVGTPSFSQVNLDEVFTPPSTPPPLSGHTGGVQVGTGGTLPKTIDLSVQANEKTLLQKNIGFRSSVTSDRIALRKKVVIYLEIPTLIVSVKTLIPK